MKSNFKIFVLLAALGALGWTGCNTAFPTSYMPSSGPSAAMVANFESGLSVNPQLAEANRPGNQVVVPGAVSPIGGSGVVLNSALASPGAAGTSQYMHVWGSVNDPGNSSYPSIQLQIPLEKSPAYSAYFDASFFTGVKFYIKVMGSDSAGKKSFSIPIAQTQPPSAGGTCNLSASSNACYNDFNVVYTSTNGAWQLETLPFSSFTRGNYGAAVTPTTLSGSNLQQILMLDWTEGNNNVMGLVNVDFSVDEVQFY